MHEEMNENALEACNTLKAMAHEDRLKTLCFLVSGEKTVADIQKFLGIRQAAASQQLSRLRLEGMIVGRRDGKTIRYCLADGRVHSLISVIYELFCSENQQ